LRSLPIVEGVVILVVETAGGADIAFVYLFVGIVGRSNAE